MSTENLFFQLNLFLYRPNTVRTLKFLFTKIWVMNQNYMSLDFLSYFTTGIQGQSEVTLEWYVREEDGRRQKRTKCGGLFDV